MIGANFQVYNSFDDIQHMAVFRQDRIRLYLWLSAKTDSELVLQDWVFYCEWHYQELFLTPIFLSSFA